MINISQFNPFSLIFLITAFINLGLMAWILRRSYSSLTVSLFLIVITLSATVGIIQFIISNIIQTEDIHFLVDFYFFGLTLLPPVFLSFVISFINKEYILFSYWYIMSIFAPAFVLLFLFWHNDIFLIMFIQQTQWGFTELSGRTESIFFVYNFYYYLPCFVLLWWFYRKLKYKKRKKNILLIILSMLIPTLGSIINYTIVPWLFDIAAFPAGIVLSTIMVCIITYAAFKYGVSILNPEVLSRQVLKTMGEAVIGFNERFEIEYVNEGAEKLLEFKAEDVLGEEVRRIMVSNKDYENLLSKLKVKEKLVINNEEFVVKSAADRLIPVSLSATKVFDAEENVVGFVLVLNDISKIKEYMRSLETKVNEIQNKNVILENLRKELVAEKDSVEQKVIERTSQLQEEQARLEASINSLNMGFLMLGQEYEVIAINDLARRIFHLENVTTSKGDGRLVGPIPGKVVFEELEWEINNSIDLKSVIRKSMFEKKLQIEEFKLKDKPLRIYINPTIIHSEEKIIGIVILVEELADKNLEIVNEKTESLRV